MAEWLGPKKEPQPAPIPNSQFYNLRHPTRYEWDDDVRALVDELFRRFNGISINTYVDHPEGWSRRLGYNTARRSFDVWDVKGRGWPINRDPGDRIVNFLWNKRGAPSPAGCLGLANAGGDAHTATATRRHTRPCGPGDRPLA